MDATKSRKITFENTQNLTRPRKPQMMMNTEMTKPAEPRINCNVCGYSTTALLWLVVGVLENL